MEGAETLDAREYADADALVSAAAAAACGRRNGHVDEPPGHPSETKRSEAVLGDRRDGSRV